MLGRSKFLDPARDFASRIDLSTKVSKWGVVLVRSGVLFGKGSTSYCGDKKRCTSEIL